MKADERRKEIVSILMSQESPVSGRELSSVLGVSRQIIVHDIAVLKASGFDILSTHSGYVVKDSPLCERVFKVRHSSVQTEDELSLIVELGGTVVDVFVWHKVYGKIKVDLNIFSKLSIENFIEGIKSGKSSELMNLTDGYHYHTVRSESETILDMIEAELSKRNYIVTEF